MGAYMPIGLEKNYAAQPLSNSELPQSNSDKHLKQESVSDGRKYLVLEKTKGADENIKTKLMCTEVKSYASSAKSIAKFMSSAEGKTQLEGMKPDQLDRVAQYLALNANAVKSKPRAVLEKIINFVTRDHFNSSKHYKAALAEVTEVKDIKLLSEKPAVTQPNLGLFKQFGDSIEERKTDYLKTFLPFAEAANERHIIRNDIVEGTEFNKDMPLKEGDFNEAKQKFIQAFDKLQIAKENLTNSSTVSTIQACEAAINCADTAWNEILSSVKKDNAYEEHSDRHQVATEAFSLANVGNAQARKSFAAAINNSVQVCDHIHSNYDEFTNLFIQQIPKIGVSAANSSSTLPLFNELNNNGILVEEDQITRREGEGDAGIDRDGEIITLIPASQVTIEGKTYQFPEGYGFYDPVEKRLYAEMDDARYHDAQKVSGGGKDPIVISLADGSGHDTGARPIARRVVEVTHNYVSKNLVGCKTTHDMLKLQLEGIKAAQKAVVDEELKGDTTFIQAAVVGNILTGVCLGDSKIVVFRKSDDGNWQCIDPLNSAKGSLDVKFSGGQITGKFTDEVKSNFDEMSAFAMELRDGDVVMAFSDGYVDNFNPIQNKEAPPKEAKNWEKVNPEHVEYGNKHALSKIEKVIEGSEGEKDISTKLQSFIQQNTFETILAALTRDDGAFPDRRGKADDAGSAWFTYKSPQPVAMD